MKKLLIVLLAFVMVFAFAACGEKTEPAADEAQPVTSIDLGGGLGEYSLEGSDCGQNYEAIEAGEEWQAEGYEVTLYADLESNVPYIAVYRCAKDGRTLDEIAQEMADLYADGYFQTMKDHNYGCESKYLCGKIEDESDFYYWTGMIMEDGDDFVEIDFFNKTEEIAIGDTGVYAWVPVGYTDELDEESIEHGAVFECSYSEECYFPYFWIGEYPETNLYDYDTWYWSDVYRDGLPITEEEYNKIVEKEWNFDTCKEYYNALGVDVVYASIENDEELPYNGEIYSLDIDGKHYATELAFAIDGTYYIAWLGSKLDPRPAVGGTFLASLHTK